MCPLNIITLYSSSSFHHHRFMPILHLKSEIMNFASEHCYFYALTPLFLYSHFHSAALPSPLTTCVASSPSVSFMSLFQALYTNISTHSLTESLNLLGRPQTSQNIGLMVHSFALILRDALV